MKFFYLRAIPLIAVILLFFSPEIRGNNLNDNTGDVTMADSLQTIVFKQPFLIDSNRIVASPSLKDFSAEGVILNNVTINGEYHVKNNSNATFNNCKFVYNLASDDSQHKGHYAIYFGTSGNVVVNDCDFTNTIAKGILVYDPSNGNMGNLEVNNCTFQADAEKDNGAVEIHCEKFTSAGTIVINNSSCDSNYTEGIWHETNAAEGVKWFTVKVNGVEEQTPQN